LNGKYFSNKELSYMRKDVVNKRLWRHVYGPTIKLFDDPPNTFIDITANIGGDIICAGLQPDIKNIIGYEMQKNVADMLDKIIELYGIKNKTIIRNEKFTKNTLSIYKEEFKNAIVIIDPPFEIGNNSDNFNLSIDSRPIYYIVEDILKAGAAFVILSMPQNFEYNIKFAEDNEQRVSAYKTKIDLKMYLVGKNKKMPHGNSYMINSKAYVDNDYDKEFEKLYHCSIDKIN
jgi:16S rRNA G966 N2-methylase RsmD